MYQSDSTLKKCPLTSATMNSSVFVRDDKNDLRRPCQHISIMNEGSEYLAIFLSIITPANLLKYRQTRYFQLARFMPEIYALAPA